MFFYCFSVVLQFTKMHVFISKINKEIIECVVVFVCAFVCLFVFVFFFCLFCLFWSFFPGCFHIFSKSASPCNEYHQSLIS